MHFENNNEALETICQDMFLLYMSVIKRGVHSDGPQVHQYQEQSPLKSPHLNNEMKPNSKQTKNPSKRNTTVRNSVPKSSESCLSLLLYLGYCDLYFESYRS